MTRRSLVPGTCAAVAVLATIAAVALATTDGFDVNVLGVRVRAHSPELAWQIAGLAAVGFLISTRAAWWPWLQIVTGQAASAGQAAGRLTAVRIPPITIALALTVAVLIVGVLYACRAVGGADSYGYVSLAHLMRQGQLLQPQPWVAEVPWPFAGDTFTPLGYRTASDGTSLVPVYSPGLSALMAIAMVPFGACAPYFVGSCFAAVAVFGTFLLGRQVGTDWTGVGAAWLFATSPTFLYMTTQPMSDVPVTAMWIVTLWLTARQTPLSALGAGMAAAWAVAIRMNLAPLVMAPALWLLWRAWQNRAGGLRACLPLVAFSAGLAPGVVVLAMYNAHLYESAWSSGYGSAAGWFSQGHFLPNVARYSRWLSETQTPLVWAGVIAIAYPFARLWPRATTRPVIGLFALFTLLLFVEYALYTIFDVWWYLRFLLPAFPLVLVGLAQVAAVVTAKRTPTVAIVTVAVLAAIGLRGINLARQEFAFDLRDAVGQFAAAGRVARAVTEPSSVIYSMQHSGSLRHYAGRMTMRWDQLDPFWLDRSVAWFRARGIHAYAVLDHWEVADWRRRFASRNALGALNLSPIRVFEGSSGTALYDLMATEPVVSRRVAITPLDNDCQPPAPPAVFSLRP